MMVDGMMDVLMTRNDEHTPHQEVPQFLFCSGPLPCAKIWLWILWSHPSTSELSYDLSPAH